MANQFLELLKALSVFLAQCCSFWQCQQVTGGCLLLILDYALKDLEALGGLVRPHFELLIEDLLILVLDQAFVSLIVFLDDLDGFRLQRPFEELLQAVVVHLVLFDVDGEVPIDHIEEYLLQLVEFLHLDETALAGEEVVRVEDVGVELLGHECRGKYEPIRSRIKTISMLFLNKMNWKGQDINVLDLGHQFCGRGDQISKSSPNFISKATCI